MAFSFRNLTEALILDGATGTELQKRGMPSGVCGEEWILAHPEALMDVQRRYVAAGSRAVYAPTFGANRISLSSHGLGDRVRDFCLALVELSRKATGRTLYVLDEPTTGLHMADVQQLDSVLQKLADAGNTLVVIEHNLDVIKTADYIIDMGPEGGDQGGTVIAEGTPEQVAEAPGSYTGLYLKPYLR